MEDKEIIDLYWQRSETAINATAKNTENTVKQLHIIFCIIMRMWKSVSMTLI